MAAISMAIVDENPILLKELSSICSRHGFHVRDTGSSAAAAVEFAAKSGLDILVVDPTMQGGMDAIAAVLARSTTTKVIAWSPARGADYAVRAIEAGARGYVLKTCTADEFILAVKAVLEGEIFITPSFAATILAALRDDRLRKRAAAIVAFSSREEQIVRLLLRGRTNKEIAATLSISDKTVKWYMSNVLQKLNAKNRTEAVIACQKLGLSHGHELAKH